MAFLFQVLWKNPFRMEHKLPQPHHPTSLWVFVGHHKGNNLSLPRQDHKL